MNRANLIRKSITKWENILNGAIDLGHKDCVLCKEFYDNKFPCKGCNVSNHTGHIRCKNTPYTKWLEHQDTHSRLEDKNDIHVNRVISCNMCAWYARAEKVFLESLLENCSKTVFEDVK